MSNRKATFAKRQREADLKDKAKAKEARIAARRASATRGGPEIDWSAQVTPPSDPTPDDPLPPPTPPPGTDTAD